MAVQLSSSYLRRGFQLIAKLSSTKLSSTKLSNDVAFDRASDLIFGWSQQKFSKVFRRMPPKKETFEDKLNGNEIGLIFKQDEGQFIFRCSHPDVSIPGRMWITDVQLSRHGSDYFLAVRLSVTSLQSCTDEVPFSCPGFVHRIINYVGLSDIYQLSRQVNHLASEEDVDSFVSFLENSERKMPAVLLTPVTYEDRFGQYMMDAEQMAFDLSGVAHVFKILPEANEYFTSRVGKQWTAFNGSVRTYYALNRDRLKCRVCGGWLIAGTPYAHRINPNLPLDKVNRVNNLVSLHRKCFNAVNNPEMDISEFEAKAQRKIIGYREKLVISHTRNN